MCIFTILHNEEIFLKLWLDYYGQSFDPEDIYVFDHCSDVPLYTKTIGEPYIPDTRYDHYWIQDTESDLPCQVKRVLKHRSMECATEMFYDILWMQEFLRDTISDLMTRYEYVVLTDPDDFLFPNPEKYKNLRDYIETLKSKGISNSRAVGYECVHQTSEPDLDWNRKIFGEQRNYWMRYGMWDKTMINSKIITWSSGFHFVIDDYTPCDQDLLLCHLQRIDYEHRLARQLDNYDWFYKHGKRQNGIVPDDNNLRLPNPLKLWKNNFHSIEFRPVTKGGKGLRVRAGDTAHIRGEIEKIPDNYIEWMVI